MTAFLGIIPFLVLLGLVFVRFGRNPEEGWAGAVVSAATIWGCSLFAASELLGLGNLLRPGPLRLLWCAAFLSTVVFAILRRGLLKTAFGRFRFPVWAWCVVPLFLATAATALLVSPNTWDTMTYHLTRVEFWLQNGSLDFYETANQRQLFFPPFAEIIVLHVHALAGGDRFDGLVQWFSNVGSAILVFDLAKRLAGGRKSAGSLAAVFIATLPIAVAESSTCQNDLAESFWLLAAVWSGIRLAGKQTVSSAVLFGATSGLAALTKGSAYPMLVPVAVASVAWMAKDIRRRIAFLCIAGATAVLLLAPHWARNTVSFGDPLGGQGNRFHTPFAPDKVLVVAWCHNVSNIYPLWPAAVRSVTKRLLSATGIDEHDKTMFWVGNSPLKFPPVPYHQDVAPNPLHHLLVLLSLSFLFVRGTRKERWAAAAWLLASASFCLSVKWQPWITRLQVPLFMFGAVLFGSAVSRLPKIPEAVVCAVLAIAALPFAFCLKQRALVSAKWTFETTWRNSPREKLYFAARPKEYADFVSVADGIAHRKCDSVALESEGNAWTYPLFPMLRSRMGSGIPRIRYLTPGEEPSSGETVVILTNAKRPVASFAENRDADAR